MKSDVPTVLPSTAIEGEAHDGWRSDGMQADLGHDDDCHERNGVNIERAHATAPTSPTSSSSTLSRCWTRATHRGRSEHFSGSQTRTRTVALLNVPGPTDN